MGPNRSRIRPLSPVEEWASRYSRQDRLRSGVGSVARQLFFSHAVRVFFQREDLGMADEAVDHSRRGGGPSRRADETHRPDGTGSPSPMLFEPGPLALARGGSGVSLP
jgi:hypothetical protein